MAQIKLQGMLADYQGIDLNRDGKIDESEQYNKEDFHNVKQPSETREAQNALIDDTTETNTSFSKVDFLHNCEKSQVSMYAGFDFLSDNGVMPPENMNLTRSLKRNSASIGGKRSDQMVQVSTGVREHQQKKPGIMQFAKNFFKPKNRGEQDGKTV